MFLYLAFIYCDTYIQLLGCFFVLLFCTNSEVILNTYVRVQTLIQTWLRVTSNQQPNTSSSTEKKHTRTHTVQPAESKHQDKERVRALAQELLILGELARPTASKCIAYGVPFSQLSQRQHEKCYISLSRSKKKNKIPDMLNLLNIMEQRRWGKRSSLCLRTGGVDHSLGWTGQRPLTKPSPPPSDSMRCQSEWLSAPVKPDGSFTLNKWMDLRATRL